MGRCVTRISHSCGTMSGLQVFEDEDGSLNGFCFSCKEYVPDPLGKGKTIKDIPKSKKIGKTEEEIKYELAEIADCTAINVKSRRLRAIDLDHYGAVVSLSARDGKTPVACHFPLTRGGSVVSYLNRLLDIKKMWFTGHVKDVDLFGWEQAKASGVKRLIITEGMYDAVALHTILRKNTKEPYIESTPAVVSLVCGVAGAVKEIQRALPEIRKRFKEVSLCFDDDEPGRKATEEVCKILPEATIISLPRKDANQCILDGVSKAAFKATVFNAVKNKNTRLVWGADLHEKAKGQAEWGVSWPWKAVTDATRGIRKGETLYIASAQKMGKSEVVDALEAHLIKEHGWKVLSAKPEQANVKSYKMLAGKIVSRVFHDPKVKFDEEAYERAGTIIRDKCCFIDLYQHLGWDTLKSDIHAAAASGVDAVFIDPITNLTNGMSSSEINTALQGIAQELAAMAKDLNIVIFIFCHVNKPPKGSTPYDRGGKITTADFAGSSAMGRSCNYTFAIEGNRDPDLSEGEKDIRDLVLLDDREFGESLRCRLKWNRKTGQFGEIG